MKVLINTIGIAIIFALGAIWLHAMPSVPAVPQTAGKQTRIPSSGQPAPAPVPQAMISIPATPTPHSIDWISISPSTVAAGSINPVTIEAHIADPAVIRNSVNLLYLSPAGTWQIIGNMNDTGINGDTTANDNVFTILISFAQYPAGVQNLRISAAYSGSLLRVQSGLFQLTVTPPVVTTAWVTITDSQQLFSIQVPSTWNLVVSESPGDDPSTIKNVYFQLPDGTVLFSINVLATSSLAGLQNGDGPQPVFLGQDSQYVFGYSETQGVIGYEPVTQNQLLQTLPQIMATFKIL